MNWRYRSERYKIKDYWNNLTGVDFENKIADLFTGIGYRVKKTPRSNDGGIDLYLTGKNKQKIAVQCKRYAQRVATHHIREFIGALKSNDLDTALFVTIKGVTEPARTLAHQNNIKIWTLDDIMNEVVSLKEK